MIFVIPSGDALGAKQNAHFAFNNESYTVPRLPSANLVEIQACLNESIELQ